jgi:hypothetical protein
MKTQHFELPLKPLTLQGIIEDRRKMNCQRPEQGLLLREIAFLARD